MIAQCGADKYGCLASHSHDAFLWSMTSDSRFHTNCILIDYFLPVRSWYINPLRVNYCHTWHMENHPCLWRQIRRVRRIQVCMARKGLTGCMWTLFCSMSTPRLLDWSTLLSKFFSFFFFLPFGCWRVCWSLLCSSCSHQGSFPGAFGVCQLDYSRHHELGGRSVEG